MRIYKKFRTSDLLFSCVRSKIAYSTPSEITNIFKNKNTILSSSCNSSTNCNLRIRTEVQDMINRMHTPILFYDGRCNEKQNKDAQGYCIWDNHTIYINYRGTADMRDVYDNIDIRHHTIDKNIKVHKGFYNQFMSIEQNITDDIRHISREYPIKNLVFTGHSLGGSLATMSSPFYGQYFKEKFKIITYTLGSATVGNIDFVNWFSSNVDRNIRIETEGDIVPYIEIHPLFYHVPNGILMKKDGTIEDQYDIKSYNYCKLIKLIIDKENFENIIRDHSCETYISKLFSLQEVVCFE